MIYVKKKIRSIFDKVLNLWIYFGDRFGGILRLFEIYKKMISRGCY